MVVVAIDRSILRAEYEPVHAVCRSRDKMAIAEPHSLIMSFNFSNIFMMPYKSPSYRRIDGMASGLSEAYLGS